MRRMVLFLVCIFCCLKGFSFPTDNEIMQMYPTLKTVTRHNFKFYYSEKIVDLLPEENRGEEKVFKFKNIDNTFLNIGFVMAGCDDIWISSSELVIVSEYGNEVIITDSGNIYIDKQFYPYSVRSIEKLQIKDGKILRVPQALYSVGIKQIANSSFDILMEPKVGSDVVARIALNTEVEVIGIKSNPEKPWTSLDSNDELWVLIRSGLGLTGWVRPFPSKKWEANYEPGFLPIFSKSCP